MVFPNQNPPSFISTHLNLNLSKQQKDPCFLNVYGQLGTVLHENTFKTLAKFELPYKFAQTEIFGSCNGLLCLKIIYGTGHGIFLYNPSIQHLKIIESFRHLYSNPLSDNVHYGFGYNERYNDHRLVKLWDFPINKVEVYSLTSDSWHELQQSPPRKLLVSHCRSGTGVYCNGATHWWTSIEAADDEIYTLDSIMAFDFNEEVFQDIELPSELRVDMDDFVHINEFQGSIGLLVSNRFSQNNDHTSYHDLWVMNEYGVSESWNKKMSDIPFLDLPARGFTKNGLVILSNGLGLIIRIEYLGIYRAKCLSYRVPEHTLVVKDIFDFVESLHLLDHENVLRKYQHGDSIFYWNLE